jgi:hypothetical protein
MPLTARRGAPGAEGQNVFHAATAEPAICCGAMGRRWWSALRRRLCGHRWSSREGAHLLPGRLGPKRRTRVRPFRKKENVLAVWTSPRCITSGGSCPAILGDAGLYQLRRPVAGASRWQPEAGPAGKPSTSASQRPLTTSAASAACPEARQIWDDIWHLEAHNSTALEGNTLALREVEILLEEGRAVQGTQGLHGGPWLRRGRPVGLRPGARPRRVDHRRAAHHYRAAQRSPYPDGQSVGGVPPPRRHRAGDPGEFPRARHPPLRWRMQPLLGRRCGAVSQAG